MGLRLPLHLWKTPLTAWRRFWLVPAVLFGIAATPASPLPVSGVSTPAVPSATTLALRGTALRYAAAVSLDHAASAVSAQEAAALAPLTAVPGYGSRWLVAESIAQTSQYVSVTGDVGIVAWWNPFDDAWIITLWTNSPQGWSLSRTGALLGADLEPDPTPADQPAAFDWPNARAGLAQTLWTHNRERVAAFTSAVQAGRLADLLADPARQSRAWTSLTERRRQQYGGLLRVQEQPGYSDYDREARAAIWSHSRAIAFDAGVQQRLAALPQLARQSLHPVMIARRADGFTLIEQSPLTPGFLVVVRLQDGVGNAHPRVTGVGAISLFGQGPR